MPYISTIQSQSYSLDRDEETSTMSIDGIQHGIDWRQVAPLAADAKGDAVNVVRTGGRYSLLLGGASYEIFARRITRADEKDSQTYEIVVCGQRFEVKVEDERTRLLAGLVKGGAATSEAVVSAPMPGLVIGVPLEAGAAVSQGQTVVILEAMKMENDLTAPITGRIKEVRVSKGQTVDQGQALIIVARE